MDLSFLSQADSATLKLELAKSALESAKNAFDAAKVAYDEILGQADSHGIPRAKLKKLSEDRVQALFDSGLIDATKAESKPAGESKRERPKKAAKSVIEAEISKSDFEGDEEENDLTFLDKTQREEPKELHS